MRLGPEFAENKWRCSIYTPLMRKIHPHVIEAMLLVACCLAYSPASASGQSLPASDMTPYRIPSSIRSLLDLSSHKSTMTPAVVARIVDGDTIVVSFDPSTGRGHTEKVRLIGVDTPEIVDPRRPVERFGKEASHFAHERLLGRTVSLAFETKLRDHYGRLLAYVFLPDGGCFNLQIVAEGYGFAYTKYPFMFMDDFLEAQASARSARRGLWGTD